ncbi:hypothetical protein NQ315_013000 [Exocentrus adspersus]|uniref:Retrotransposon gag domain-containing protein n=1 Tax=Exocentrus adspersus TaxID=1586481 RepID=A0AAV8VTN3_9CUCU|nr:hypothetical protein NQ315_013000 [Exocentrus adspersus]
MIRVRKPPGFCREHDTSKETPGFCREHDTSKENSSSATEAVEHLAKVMAGFFKDFENGPSRETTDGKVVPDFNPEDNEHNSITCCAKVDELREVFGWGLAKTWYKGLPTIKFTWNEWKEHIQAAFPPTKDYFEMLTEMLKRKKETNETYSKYYYEKMALLTQCEISGAKAVSCIIGDIEDDVVKTGAQAGNYETPLALFKYLNNKPSRAYIDSGSFCNTVRLSEVHKLGLRYDPQQKTLIRGYGNAVTESLGTCSFTLKIDNVEAKTDASVVSDEVQNIPVMVGRPFTELPGLLILKDSKHLVITEGDLHKIEVMAQPPKKVTMWPKKKIFIPQDHLVNVPVETRIRGNSGEFYVEASFRCKEGSEYCIPRTVIRLQSDEAHIPVINLSNSDIILADTKPLVRAWPCVPEPSPPKENQIFRLQELNLPPLPENEIKVGPINNKEKKDLFQLLQKQLTDDKIKHIKEVLSKPPENDYDRNVYKNYALRDGRVYRITVKGLLWLVPRGMRHEVSTGKTPSQLLLGYTPRGGTDAILKDEVEQIPAIIDDIISARREALEKKDVTQEKQKEQFDKKRKPSRKYKEEMISAVIASIRALLALLVMRSPSRTDNDIKEGLRQCTLAVRRIHKQIKKTVTIGEKQHLLAQLREVKSLASQMKMLQKKGAGVGGSTKETAHNRVHWDDSMSAFDSRIRTGVISNLKHKDPKDFYFD